MCTQITKGEGLHDQRSYQRRRPAGGPRCWGRPLGPGSPSFRGGRRRPPRLARSDWAGRNSRAAATALQPPSHLLTTLPAPAGGGRRVRHGVRTSLDVLGMTENQALRIEERLSPRSGVSPCDHEVVPERWRTVDQPGASTATEETAHGVDAPAGDVLAKRPDLAGGAAGLGAWTAWSGARALTRCRCLCAQTAPVGSSAASIRRRNRPSSTVSNPSFERASGDVRLGVTHQALELLTGRFDIGPVDRVRLPAPAVAVVGQPDGPAAREDGGPPRRHLVEAGRFVPIDEHRPRRPASRHAHAHVAVGAGCRSAAPRCVGCR